MHDIGMRMKASAAVGAGAILAMVVLGTADGGTPWSGGADATSVASTAPSTPATSIAVPTAIAVPYGGEGPWRKCNGNRIAHRPATYRTAKAVAAGGVPQLSRSERPRDSGRFDEDLTVW
jgi:hypothetical protein